MKTFEELNGKEREIVLTIMNTREVKDIYQWLTNALQKKVRRGFTPDFHYLAYCSTVTKILREAVRAQNKDARVWGCEPISLNTYEKINVREYLANNIINNLN